MVCPLQLIGMDKHWDKNNYETRQILCYWKNIHTAINSIHSTFIMNLCIFRNCFYDSSILCVYNSLVGIYRLLFSSLIFQFCHGFWRNTKKESMQNISCSLSIFLSFRHKSLSTLNVPLSTFSREKRTKRFQSFSIG